MTNSWSGTTGPDGKDLGPKTLSWYFQQLKIQDSLLILDDGWGQGASWDYAAQTRAELQDCQTGLTASRCEECTPSSFSDNHSLALSRDPDPTHRRILGQAENNTHFELIGQVSLFLLLYLKG